MSKKKLRKLGKSPVTRVEYSEDSGVVREEIGEVPVYEVDEETVGVYDDDASKVISDHEAGRRRSHAGYTRAYAEGWERMKKARGEKKE